MENNIEINSELIIYNNDSQLIAENILNEAIQFATSSSYYSNIVYWNKNDQTDVDNLELKRYSSPINIVPSNSPKIFTESPIFVTPSDINRALNDVITKRSRNDSEQSFDENSLQINSTCDGGNSMVDFPKIVSQQLHIVHSECGVSLPNVYNNQTVYFDNSSTENTDKLKTISDNELDCLSRPIEDPKLEANIQMLINEVNKLDFDYDTDISNNQTLVSGDDEQNNFNQIVNENKILNSSNDNLIDIKSTDSTSETSIYLPDNVDNFVTRKLCQTNLIQAHSNIIGTTSSMTLDEQIDRQEIMDNWEENQEQEIQVINPDYSSSENDIDNNIEIDKQRYYGPFFDIDLCGIAMNPPTLDSDDSDGGKGDVHKKASSCSIPNLETIHAGESFDTQKNLSIDEKLLQESKILCEIYQEPADKDNYTTDQQNDKKQPKKKKWNIGNRILNFFTRNKSNTSK